MIISKPDLPSDPETQDFVVLNLPMCDECQHKWFSTVFLHQHIRKVAMPYDAGELCRLEDQGLLLYTAVRCWMPVNLASPRFWF